MIVGCRVLGLCGSLRTGSYTRAALEVVLAAAGQAGAKAELLAGRSLRLPLCDGRSGAERPPGVVSLVRRAQTADALVLSSPEYCGTLSAVIKNAVEWMGPEVLTGKVVGLVAVAEGGSVEGSLMALRELCLREGAWVVPVPAAVPLAARVFGDPAAPFSRVVHAQLEALGRRLPAAAARLAGWSEAHAETP